MKTKLFLSFLLFTTTTLCQSAETAEINIRPGLWQMTTSSDLLLLVPHIPSDEMKRITDLANEYGLDLPQVEMGAAISQACITQEMSDLKTLPVLAQNELACVVKNSSRNANVYKAEFTCNNANFKGNAIAQATVTSAESFAGKAQFTGVAQGVNIDDQAQISGKWMQGNCGDVSPSNSQIPTSN